MVREIKELLYGEVVTEGAGVKLRRVFGYFEASLFDPFLMLDDLRAEKKSDFVKGFPWHPHRGIETITYVLSGDVEHEDSMGNKGMISSGDVQWMTAGSGILHQEMPLGNVDGKMSGFQLWANLPAAQKMTDPKYRTITSTEIPDVRLDNGVSIKVISGEVAGHKGPVEDVVIDPLLLDCSVPSGVTFTQAIPQGYNVFAYVIGGDGKVRDTPVEDCTVVLFEDGDSVELRGGIDGMRFLLCAGKPLNDPIAWRGPIVMNTQEELDIAYKEIANKTFVKHKS
ncbi:MAG: pirin family protein [Desulfovibrio sp.]